METLKDLLRALLQLEPIKVKAHLLNGETISYSEGEGSLKIWLKNLNFNQIAKIEFEYADGVKVSIEWPSGENTEEDDAEEDDEDDEEDDEEDDDDDDDEEED